MSESKNRKSEIEAKKKTYWTTIQELLTSVKETGIYPFVEYGGELDKGVRGIFKEYTSRIRKTDPLFPSEIIIDNDGMTRFRRDKNGNIVPDKRNVIPDWDEAGLIVCLLFAFIRQLHFRKTDIIDELGKSKWCDYSRIANDAGYYEYINKWIEDTTIIRIKEDGEYTGWMTFEEVEKYMRETGGKFIMRRIDR